MFNDLHFGIRCFLVPVSARQKIIDKINNLRSRAFKLGLPEINLMWGSLETESRMINGEMKNIQFIQAHLSGPIKVAFDGWEFVATLQHLETGENIIRAISNDFQIPEKYKTAGSDCEHCRVNRYRKDTYIVRHINNDFVQVGSSCIKDFLGNNSPDNIIQAADLASNIVQYMNSFYQDSSYINPDDILINLEQVLAQTSACIRDYGWISKSTAYNRNTTSTASMVLDNITKVESLFKSNVSNVDEQTAFAAINWAENLSDYRCNSSDYLHNIRAIARAGAVNRKTIGYAASIISSFQKEHEREMSKTNISHVGTVKSREEFDVTLANIFTGHSSFGTFYKYTFRDMNRNILVWTTSHQQHLEKDKKYKIKATVKAHSYYKDIPQTQINRCEIVTYYEGN